MAFFGCWSPRPVTLPELVAVAGARWGVEDCFAEAKNETGLDHCTTASPALPPVVMEPRGGHAVCPRCSRADDAALGPLFIVTGASAAGKTAVLSPLARRLRGRCVTFDADLLLDPAGALSDGRPIIWPAFLDAWLAIAHGVAQSGMPTVLLGPVIPDHLSDLPARRWIGAVHFIVLDCPDELRRDRINARPPWRNRDIEQQVEFGRWLRRNIPDRVDTSSGTPEDTATAIATWIDRHLPDTRTTAK